MMSSLRRRNPSSESTTGTSAASSSNPGSSSAGGDGGSASPGQSETNNNERRLSFLKPTPKEPIPITLLIEIVSAYDLSPPFDNVDTADPFVIIRKGSNEIHRTKPIRKNIEHPIWTIGTNSLYLLKTTKQELDKDDGLNFEVYHRAVSLGMVTVSSRALYRGRGKRIEYPLKKRVGGLKDDKKKGKAVEQKGILALRFRHASEKDIAFMDPKNRRGVSRALGSDISEVAAGASDMNFKKTTGPSVFKSTSKTGRDKIERFRVQPYPDPEKVEETRWLSDEELNSTCLLPSRKWVEAGSGIMGMIYVEILKCDKLPNMDTGVNDKTDAFVALSFEDALVRTDVIHDSLSPRWMPWCTRAFAFPIAHVSSILMMAVFDYDAGPLNYHDPIGRVVINTSHFRSRTSYVLHYALHEDPNQNAEPRGTLCIRFRVDWGDEKKTIQQAFTKPPRFHVNVENEKAFKVLRYMCEGEINMDKATMTTTKLYAYELGSYIIKYFYVIDVLVGVLLWRGRVDFTMKRPDWITTTPTTTPPEEEKKSDANGETKTDETNNQNQENPDTSSSSSSPSDDEIKFNVWFPIHSIALFQAGIIVIEKPWLIPAFFFLSIAWVMHTINYRTSRHPSPWRRCKSMHESNMVLMGRPPYPPVTVKANEGIDESTKLLLVDEVKRDRVLNFFIAVLYAGLKYRRLNKSADMESYAIATEDKQWTFLGDKLYYLHLLFSMLCVYLRMGRNVINWDSHYSRWLTVTCAAAGVILLILPMRHVMLWTARIIVWSLLGPWMKFVDMRYFRPHYKTFEELMAMDEPKAPEYDIDALLEGVNMEALKRQARIATEDSIKLKEMRDLRFGKFSELVPSFDISRFPSVPLPESTAEPYLGDDDDDGNDENKDETKEEPLPSSSEDNSQQQQRQQKEGFRDLPREDVHWSVVPGQKLKGTMIQSIQTSENFGCDQSLVTKSIDEYDEISSVDNSAHSNS